MSNTIFEYYGANIEFGSRLRTRRSNQLPSLFKLSTVQQGLLRKNLIERYKTRRTISIAEKLFMHKAVIPACTLLRFRGNSLDLSLYDDKKNMIWEEDKTFNIINSIDGVSLNLKGSVQFTGEEIKDTISKKIIEELRLISGKLPRNLKPFLFMAEEIESKITDVTIAAGTQSIQNGTEKDFVSINIFSGDNYVLTFNSFYNTRGIFDDHSKADLHMYTTIAATLRSPNNFISTNNIKFTKIIKEYTKNENWVKNQFYYNILYSNLVELRRNNNLSNSSFAVDDLKTLKGVA
jgi:hypothetical protein